MEVNCPMTEQSAVENFSYWIQLITNTINDGTLSRYAEKRLGN